MGRCINEIKSEKIHKTKKVYFDNKKIIHFINVKTYKKIFTQVQKM